MIWNHTHNKDKSCFITFNSSYTPRLQKSQPRGEGKISGGRWCVVCPNPIPKRWRANMHFGGRRGEGPTLPSRCLACSGHVLARRRTLKWNHIFWLRHYMGHCHSWLIRALLLVESDQNSDGTWHKFHLRAGEESAHQGNLKVQWNSI